MRRFGRLFVTPTGRWSWTRPFHRLVHRNPSEACFVCSAVWSYLDTLPNFVEAVRAGEADIAAGRVRPFVDRVVADADAYADYVVESVRRTGRADPPRPTWPF